MQNDGNMDSEIARRQTNSTTRRRSKKPDVESFGKINKSARMEEDSLGDT